MASLTQGQVSELQRRLRQRHAELRAVIRGELLAADEMRYADLAGRVHDSGDEAVADLLADLDVVRIDRQVTEIRRIEAALRCIDMGSYGMCRDCGGDIGYERLESQPDAQRCVTCQEHYEKSYAHGGTPSL
ncbi:MAG: TraR/DksA family transcriptional regulator [Gammaproteobacteria bacterium]|jgi:DnaK suppressor protein